MQQELLPWSIATGGKVSVAIVSPQAAQDGTVETFGMTWDDLLAWFKSEREKRLAAVAGGEEPLPVAPGAQAFAQATAAWAAATAQAQPYPGSSSAPVTPAAASTITSTAAVRPTPASPVPATSATSAPSPLPTKPPATPNPSATPRPAPSGPASASPSGLVTGLSFLACGGMLVALVGIGVLAFIRARKSGGMSSGG